MNKNNIFKDIVEQYTSALYNRAYYLLSDYKEAEDIVQEVFISAYESYEKYQATASMKTWLMGILKNKVADFYRKKYKQTDKISLDHYFTEDGSWKKDQILQQWNTLEESLFDDDDFKATFDDCIEKLPQKWKIPFKMYYLEEKKTEILSQELDLSATNIWKILQRGRFHLKDCLDTNWFNK